MSREGSDERPKIISFPMSFGGLDIAARQNILWPCHAFRISIPEKKKQALNIFEETILKLTEIESGDTEKLSAATCLDKDLVSFIQNRLRQLGLVCNRYELTVQGRNILEKWEKDAKENREYTVATVFVDLLGGTVLPHVNTSSDISYENIENFDPKSNWVTFYFGSAGKSKTIRARRLRPGKKAFWKKIPDTRDIVKATREFRKRFKRYAILKRNIDRSPPPLPRAEAISIQDVPEFVYLSCQAIVQKGNTDILVTDGFGFGFSDSFAGYLTTKDWKWLVDLKRKGIVEDIETGSKDEEHGNGQGFGGAIRKYPKIFRTLRQAYEEFGKASLIQVSSSNEEKERKRLIGLTATCLYDAVEWTLRQIVSENPVDHWEKYFSSRSFGANDRILRSFAKKLGFDASARTNYLLQVKPGKIKAIERGVCDMQPLLALSIAGAIQYEDHPMHALAIDDSGALSFILSLKKVRDPFSHGNHRDIGLSIDELESYRDRTARLIRSLIPDLAESLDSRTAPKRTAEDINQMQLKAIVELDRFFGLNLVQSMRPDLREELSRIVKLEQKSEALDLQYVKSLAAAMQLAFFEMTVDRKTSGNSDRDLKNVAFEKAVEAGFVGHIDEVPKTVSTVNPKKVHEAFHGISSTLGAHLIALFLLYPTDELIRLRQALPELIEIVDRLLQLRKHGNQQLRPNQQKSLPSLKNRVFNAIKIVTEV